MSLEFETCTKTEYAELRGLSTSYVSRLHRMNRLVLDSRGRIVVKSTDALIDALRDGRGGDRTGKHAAMQAASSDAPAPAPAGAEPAIAAAFPAMTLSEASRGEKLERTRLLQIEVAERSGKLLRRDVVESETFKRARQVQETLMALKDRLSPLLAIESDQSAINDMLDAEFRHLLAALAASTSSAAQAAA